MAAAKPDRAPGGGAVEAGLWRAVVDALVAHGEALPDAILLADDLLRLRRAAHGEPPSAVPPRSLSMPSRSGTGYSVVRRSFATTRRDGSTPTQPAPVEPRDPRSRG